MKARTAAVLSCSLTRAGDAELNREVTFDFAVVEELDVVALVVELDAVAVVVVLFVQEA